MHSGLSNYCATCFTWRAVSTSAKHYPQRFGNKELRVNLNYVVKKFGSSSYSTLFVITRIDDQFHVKLTDMALARDFFPNDYHCLGDNENRPIKWMAMESLVRREFSTASDIVSSVNNFNMKGIYLSTFLYLNQWSFGVVLWEVTTLAQQPYVEIDPFEVGRVLRDGYRLTQPVNCPDEL